MRETFVIVVCPFCTRVIGRAPKGGMAEASAKSDKVQMHLPDCRPGIPTGEYR